MPDPSNPTPLPPRPRRKGLTHDRVVEAALAMIDAEGLDALTIRGLAARLGVEPMSLYAHVRSKDDLLDDVAALLAAPVPPLDPALPWATVLADGFRAYRQTLLAHPNAVPLAALRTRPAAQRLGPLEAALGTLRRSGLDLDVVVVGQITLVAYTLGFVLQEVMSRGDQGAYTAELQRAPADFPNVLAVAPVAARLDVDTRFDLGLELILAGLRGQAPDRT